MKKTLIRASIFLLNLIIAVFLMIILSNILHVTAPGIFENQDAIPLISSLLSLAGFIVILLYSIRVVFKTSTGELKHYAYAFRETIVPLVYLTPLTIAAFFVKVELFSGILGYVYAPFLSLLVIGWNPLLSLLVYLAVYYVSMFVFRVMAMKKINGKKETDNPESSD